MLSNPCQDDYVADTLLDSDHESRKDLHSVGKGSNMSLF